MSKEALIQSVPNFSEGRDLKKVERIVDAFRAKPGIKLLDYSTDPDHNRCVITVAGQQDPLRDAMIAAISTAVEVIDMTRHEGKHPRIGCADVIPFIPLRNSSIQQADRLARQVAQTVAEQLSLPVYLYGNSASAPYRIDVSDIRRGQFEGLEKKMQDKLWLPDYGPAHPHPTGGASIIGARMPVIYYNINLDTSNVEIARAIGRRVRHINGGFRCVKAMGILLEERNIAQVTMNLTDYTQTAVYRVFETVKMEARRYGVRVLGSEVVGMLPMQALVDCAEYYLQIEDFSAEQILEQHF